MANYRTTSDIKSEVLRKCGEKQDGTSQYDAVALTYINEAFQGVLAGGSEFGVDVDEPWSWAKAKNPIILILEPKYDTGTISLTSGSANGVFSSAPTTSLEGWHLKINNRPEYFRIVKHNAAETSFELDSEYTEDTGATLSYEAYKLDYELADNQLIITSENNKLDFQEASSTPLVATLSNGAYTPNELAVELKSQLESAGNETYTVSFDVVTRKFSISHAGSYLDLLFGSGANANKSVAETLGFERTLYTGATSYVATNSINAIQRLVSPFINTRDNRYYNMSTEESGKVYQLDKIAFNRDYPLTQLETGIPDRFCEISHKSNGVVKVRFNRFPETKTRIECDYIPIAPDLFDSTNSVPIIPRAYRSFLAHAAAHYLMLDKSDNKAQSQFQLAQAKLRALVNHNRKPTQQGSKDYGRLIARPSKMRILRDEVD